MVFGTLSGSDKAFVGDACAGESNVMRLSATSDVFAPAPSQELARRSNLDPHEAFLRALIAETDDITLEEMRGRVREEHDLTIGLGTLRAFLDVRGLTYKKMARAT